MSAVMPNPSVNQFVRNCTAIGAILPLGDGYTRKLADAVAVCRICLDRPKIACTIVSVVAAPPQWAETHSLIRYPSPDGRSCAVWCRPPFFRFELVRFRTRRGLAHTGLFSIKTFDAARKIGFTAGAVKKIKIRGKILCVSLSSLCYAWLHWPVLRRAATQFLNRPCWGLVPGQARRLSLMATSVRGPSSVAPQTSPIASIRQESADLITCPVTGASLNQKAIGVVHAGGLLPAKPMRNAAWHRTVRRVQTCSRRS